MITRNKPTKQDINRMEAALEAAESIIDSITDMIWVGEGGEIVKSLSSDEIELIYYTLCDAMVPISDALSYKQEKRSAIEPQPRVEDQAEHLAGIRRLKEALELVDWEYEDATDKKDKSNERDSVERVADYFASLDLSEREFGERLMSKYVPKKWAWSWNKIIKIAFDKRSRISIERAERLGALSSNPKDANYRAHYSYSYSQDGMDYFRHHKTGEYISSPVKEPRKTPRPHKRTRTPNL